MKKYILLLLLGFTGTLNAQTIELNVTHTPQDKDKWCVAASTKCILDYYGKGKSQCNIMEYVRINSIINYGTWPCCAPDPPTPGWVHPCNKEGVILGYSNEKGSAKDILWHFGNCPSYVAKGTLSTTEIRKRLELNRPQIIHFDYYGTSAHAVVIYGIEKKNLIDYIGIMDPVESGFSDWIEYDLVLNNGGRYWYGFLFPTSCSTRGDYPCHCYNGYRDEDETGIDCGGASCPPCTTTPPPWLCMNRKKDSNEEGVDCGGACPQKCEDLPPCANCKGDAGELMVDCGGPCGSCYDVLDEINITYTSQLYLDYSGSGVLRPEFMAFNKITAGGTATIKSGRKTSFITEKGGSIVLLPGFKAESGSNFSTQMLEDLSGSSRICGAICRIEHLSHHHSVPMGGYDFLIIYNLHKAVEIEYKIYTSGGTPVYSNSFDISRNGAFQLWDCVTGTVNPKGTVWYYIVYEVLYCNGASYGGTHNFYVNYLSSKSSNEEPDETENLDFSHFSSSAHLEIQNETSTPVLAIIPNPNAGTFQMETNFSLSDIANLKVINSLGATIYETQNVTANTIQLQNSASGLHFVVIILTDGSVLTEKMLIQK